MLISKFCLNEFDRTRHKRRRKGSTQEALDARGGDIARDGIVLDLGSNRYKVSSQSVPDAYYEVTVMHVCWKCTCPYHVRVTAASMYARCRAWWRRYASAGWTSCV